MSYQEYRCCFNCGSNDFKTKYKFRRGYFDSKKYVTHSWDGGLNLELSIVKCKKCKTVFQNPCINESALKYFYPEDIIPNKLPKEILKDNSKFKFLIEDVLLTKYPFKKNITVIDVGARYGLLSFFLKQLGFECYSLEMNKKCIEAANSIGINNIYPGTIDDLNKILPSLNIDRVNVFTLCDLIEHLIDPSLDFEVLSSFQFKGDRIILTTPNFNSLGRYFFGKNWYYIHGQHTNYFNGKSIQKFANNNGYIVEQIHKVKFYKNIFKIFPNLVKYLKFKFSFLSLNSDQKLWFAKYRPHFFDTMIVVLKKI